MTVLDSHPDERTDGATLRERKKQQTRSALHEAALRLIDEQGLEHTTIEQICRDADVSPRTFFNYFPTKAAAALDLPIAVIDESAMQRFREARGLLVPALCDAIAGSADLGSERERVKELITRRPELMPALTQWMHGVRTELVALAAERTTDPGTAELAVTLVMSALGSVVHHANDSSDPVEKRLRDTVSRLVACAEAPLD